MIALALRVKPSSVSPRAETKGLALSVVVTGHLWGGAGSHDPHHMHTGTAAA